MKHLRIVLLSLLLACTLPALAADPSKQAEDAARLNQSAVTIYVDATLGMRKDRAAAALTRAHDAFARHSYQVIDVSTYNENGDLQGFFVTYRREPSRTP